MTLIDLVSYVAPTTIIFNIVVGLVIALKLYIKAPERDVMGFNKYWHALMMDAAPGKEKNLLKYDDDENRNQLFLAYRIVSIVCMVVIALCVLVAIIFG
jgi:hypothetical protein